MDTVNEHFYYTSAIRKREVNEVLEEAPESFFLNVLTVSVRDFAIFPV